MEKCTYDQNGVFEAVKRSLNTAGEAVKNSTHGVSAGDREWTKAIKLALCHAGHEFDPEFYVCAAGIESADADHGEWLYDVCWLDYKRGESRKPEFLRSAALILESEWGGRGDVEDDFEKLLVGRALVKCLVWDPNRVGCQPCEMVKRLSYLLQKFSPKLEDDLYLLAAYIADGRFRFWRMTRTQMEEVTELTDSRE